MAFEKAVPVMRLSHKISLFRDFIRCGLRSCFRRASAAFHPRKRVLVVRLDRIGDFALYLPFAAELRRIYPKEQYEITLLGRSLWMPLARKKLDFDHYKELDPAAFLSDSRYRREQLKRVAEAGFDLLLQPRFYRELLVEDLIALAADAPQSIAFSSTPCHLQSKLMRMSDRIYTELLNSHEMMHAHELVRNRAYLKHLAPDADGISNPWLNPPPLPPSGPDSRPYAVFLPGSGKAEKLIWPPEKFGELARKLENRGYAVAVCGTADESPLAAALLACCRLPQYNLVGQQSIEEFAATLAHASLVIGNDTGGIHIAAISGVPSLAVAGGGQPGIFLPYPEKLPELPGIMPPAIVSRPCRCSGCGWNCRFDGQNAYECIRGIPVAQVEKELSRLLCVPACRTSSR